MTKSQARVNIGIGLGILVLLYFMVQQDAKIEAYKQMVDDNRVEVTQHLEMIKQISMTLQDIKKLHGDKPGLIEPARFISQVYPDNSAKRELMVAIISVESEFDNTKISKMNAVGYAQVRPATWNHLGLNLRDPKDNIQASAQILEEYTEACGSLKCAVAAYNVGISSYMKNPKSEAAFRYTSKVNKKLEILSI